MELIQSLARHTSSNDLIPAGYLQDGILTVEAGRTLILEREATIRVANDYGLVIVAWRAPPGA
jgi:hypothetical protein